MNGPTDPATPRISALSHIYSVDGIDRMDSPSLHRGEVEEACALIEKHNLWGYGLLHNKDGLAMDAETIKSCLKSLPLLFRELAREMFLSIFPQSCAGCLMLNLLGAAEITKDAELVSSVLKNMLNDSHGDIFAIHKVSALRGDAREAWVSKDVEFPGDGRCERLRPGMQIIVRKFGLLIASPSFAQAMNADVSACVAFLSKAGFFCRDSTAEDLAMLEKKANEILYADWRESGLFF